MVDAGNCGYSRLADNFCRGRRGSKLLGHIKDVEALLHVVRCFEDGSIPFAFETIDRCGMWKPSIWN